MVLLLPGQRISYQLDVFHFRTHHPRLLTECLLLRLPSWQERFVDLPVRQVGDVVQERAAVDENSDDVEMVANDAPVNGAHALVVLLVDVGTLKEARHFTFYMLGLSRF